MCALGAERSASIAGNELDFLTEDSNGLLKGSERRTIPPDEETTPVSAMFVVHHYDAPAVIDKASWHLAVAGKVKRSLQLTMSDLKSLPSRDLRAMTECSGGGRRFFVPLVTQGGKLRNGTIANVEWKGVSLASVLEMAGLEPGGQHVVVTGADGDSNIHFAKGLPVTKALDGDTILAWELNGEPIPHLHGGPVRLVVPGWYGIWSVKWVASVAVQAEEFHGYWQKEKYVYKWPDGRPDSLVVEQGLKSLIVTLQEGERLRQGRHRIAGYAWSGQTRVTGVDIRIAMSDWVPAKITSHTGRWEWIRWEYEWTPTERGRYAISSRATDELGNVQRSEPLWNELGYGYDAIQTVVVDVHE